MNKNQSLNEQAAFRNPSKKVVLQIFCDLLYTSLVLKSSFKLEIYNDKDYKH